MSGQIDISYTSPIRVVHKNEIVATFTSIYERAVTFPEVLPRASQNKYENSAT